MFRQLTALGVLQCRGRTKRIGSDFGIPGLISRLLSAIGTNAKRDFLRAAFLPSAVKLSHYRA